MPLEEASATKPFMFPIALRPQLVLIHGLHSSPQEFSLLKRILDARQVEFHCLQVPGYTHGLGEPRMDWRDWLRSARAALDARYASTDSLVIGGLCVGGALAAGLARDDDRICGVVLMSPTFAYDGWAIRRWMSLRAIAYRTGLDRWISIREREPFGIKNLKMRSRVQAELAAGGQSSIGPGRLPLRAIRETERVYAASVAWLSDLRVPLLVMHARDDEIATLASVRNVVCRAGPLARLLVFEDSFHMITIDNDRKRVANALADFVGAPAAEASAPPSQSMQQARSKRARRGVPPPSTDIEERANDHL